MCPHPNSFHPFQLRFREDRDLAVELVAFLLRAEEVLLGLFFFFLFFSSVFLSFSRTED